MVEKSGVLNSLVMGAHKTTIASKIFPVEKWIEAWDYVGDVRFKGFLAGEGDNRSLFVFFERTVVGKELKPG